VNVDTGQWSALAERIEAMDRQMQALSRGLRAAGQYAGRPEIAAEVDAALRARRRARLQLIQGGKR
jgi:type II secretory pathway component PulJ